MHFPRVALGALLSAGLMVFACSDEDTVVAVNVNAAKELGYVSLLRVTISQSGQQAITAEFTPVNVKDDPKADGGSHIAGENDYRITLPSSWEEGKATVEVVSVTAGGQADVSDSTIIDIKKEETVAAFLDLKPEAPPMGGAGGMGGTGGTGGTDTGGTGGTDAGGTGGTDAGTGGLGGALAGTGGAEAGTGGALAGTGGVAGEGNGTAGTGGS